MSIQETKKEGSGTPFVNMSTSPVSTMMACPEGKKEQKFVTAWLGEDGMLRYNSKLPIVVYT
ncbi:hypothetical protein MJN51_36610, partial [Salmonella enterica subsp. enterica serovar Kentucky]|nr:hypothetical protein [Salmonella enterica subsp. enterica serovar Kentucky]